jgi:hypothetical protein
MWSRPEDNKRRSTVCELPKFTPDVHTTNPFEVLGARLRSDLSEDGSRTSTVDLEVWRQVPGHGNEKLAYTVYVGDDGLVCGGLRRKFGAPAHELDAGFLSTCNVGEILSAIANPEPEAEAQAA